MVKNALLATNTAAFWTEATIIPVNDYNLNPDFQELDDEIIPFLNNQLDTFGIDTGAPPNVRKQAGFTDFLMSCLFESRVYGFTISELIWESSDEGFRLHSCKIKPPWNFEFKVDEEDDLTSVDHYYGGNTGLEPERFLIATWPSIKYGNYYGQSDLQPILHDIDIIQVYEKSLLKGASLSAYRPLTVWLNGLGMADEDYLAYKEALRKAETNSVVFAPMWRTDDGELQKAAEIEAQPERVSAATIQQVWTIIQEKIKWINRALGIPDELGQVTVAVGSYAKSKTQFDMFLSRVEQCQRWVKDVANRIIHTIIYYNYQNLPLGYVLPQWAYPEIEEDYLNDRSIFIERLFKLGIMQLGTEDEDWARDLLGLPIRSIDNIQTDTPPAAPEPTGFSFFRRKK